MALACPDFHLAEAICSNLKTGILVLITDESDMPDEPGLTSRVAEVAIAMTSFQESDFTRSMNFP